jgi:hypothetical protein
VLSGMYHQLRISVNLLKCFYEAEKWLGGTVHRRHSSEGTDFGTPGNQGTRMPVRFDTLSRVSFKYLWSNVTCESHGI